MNTPKTKAVEYNVNEIFYSIQGEGTRVGKPCIFVRFQGCMLRCVWCDTPYALDRRVKADLMTAKEIYDKIKEYPTKFLMLTGGEPLEQKNIKELTEYFCDKGYEVVIETNGQQDISKRDKRAIVVMDFKCPDSKMEKKNNYNNIKKLNKNDELKFVIGSEKDFNWSINIIEKYKLENKLNAILMSPVFGKIENITLSNWILNSGKNIRFQVQLHKEIWDPNTRGV